MVQWRPRADVSLDMANHALDLLEHIGDAQIPAIMNLSHPASLETLAVLLPWSGAFPRREISTRLGTGSIGDSPTRGATYPVWKVSGLGSLGLLEAWCGNTERAVALSDEALATAKEVGLLAHPCVAEAYLTSTLVALEKGDPGHASLSLHEGIVRSEANRRSQLSWFGHLESALLQEADGKRELAMETVLSARSDLGAAAPPVVADRLVALQARLLRLGGSAEQAQRSLRNASPHSAPVAFELAAAALTLGDARPGPQIGRRVPPFLRCGRPLATVEGLLLAAWLSETDGSSEIARRQLVEAMAIAEGHSLVEMFVRAGPTTVRMVSDLPDTHSAFRQQILRRAQALATPSLGGDLVEPMTVRELEILSYLPSRLTNTELADHFYVSVNTIKTHMVHIYRKLGVTNRNAAVSRASRLGLSELPEHRPRALLKLRRVQRCSKSPAAGDAIRCPAWFDLPTGICRLSTRDAPRGGAAVGAGRPMLKL